MMCYAFILLGFVLFVWQLNGFVNNLIDLFNCHQEQIDDLKLEVDELKRKTHDHTPPR